MTVWFSSLLTESLLLFFRCSVEKIPCSAISGNKQISNFGQVGSKDTEQISLELPTSLIPENWENSLGSTIVIVTLKMC